MPAQNFLNTLITQHAEDALTNHFEVIFNPINALKDQADYTSPLAIRVLTASIPAQTISTYEVPKRGRKFSRPSGLSEQSYEFSFTYRIDKNFNAYRMISDWMKVIQAPVTMAMSSDVGLNAIRTFVTVNAVDTLGNIRATWIMEGFFPKEQAAIEFDENSGDPLIISVTGDFLNIKYPLLAESSNISNIKLTPSNSTGSEEE